MNNYAISTDGVATALQNSAAALVTAGNDMDEAVALVTAGNVITQDPDKVGAGMRTIALRLTGTKSAVEQLRDMGEETDDVVTSQSKLRDIIMEATKVASNEFKGFDIFDDNGNYKSTYDIMLGLSEIYKEIAETDKEMGTNNLNLLLETIAGKTRANIAASILQNGEILENAYKSSQQADGSAMKENEKYLDSIEGKMQQFTNSAHEALNVAIDSDWIKTLIDGATSLLNVLTEILKIINEIPGGLMTLAPILGAGGIFGKDILGAGGPISWIKGGWSDLFAKGTETIVPDAEKVEKAVSILHGASMTDFSELGDEGMATAIKNLVDNKDIDAASVSVEELSSNLTTTVETSSKAGKAMSKFGGILKSAFASLAVSGAIALTIWGLSQLVKWADNAHDSFDELNDRVSNIKDTFQNSQKQISNNASTIDEIKDRYSALSEGVDSFGNNISLSEESFKEYQSICNQIAGMYPTLVSGYDAQGNAIVNLKGNVDALTDSLKEQTKAAYESAFVGTDGNKGVQDIIDAYKKTQDTDGIDYFMDKIKFWDGLQVGGAFSTKELVDYEKQILNMYSGSKLSDLDPNEVVRSISKLDNYKGDLTSYLNQQFDFKNIRKWTDDEWSTFLSKVSDNMAQYQSDIQQSISDIRWAAEVSVHLSPDYDSLDSDMQNVASMIANNLPDEMVTQWKNSDQIKAYTNNLVTRINELSPELQKQFGEMFGEDALNVPMDEALGKFNDFSQQLSDVFHKDEIVGIEQALGVDKIRSTWRKLHNFLGNVRTDTRQLQRGLNNLTRDGIEKFLTEAAGITDVTKLMEILNNVVDEINADSAKASFNEFTSEVQKSMESLANLNTILSSSFDGNGLTISFDESGNVTGEYGELLNLIKELPNADDYNLDELFISTANGIRLDTGEFRKLKTELNQLQIDNISNQIKDLNTQLLQARHAGNDTLVAELETEIQTLDMLSAAFEGNNSAYQNWLAAQSGGDAGDMYDSIVSTGMKGAKETYEKGETGNGDFRAFVELMSGKDLSDAYNGEVAAAYEEALPMMQRYFTESNEGMTNFIQDMEKAGDVIKDANGSYNFADGMTTEKIADDLGVSVELADILLGKLEDHEWKIDMVNENDMEAFNQSVEDYVTGLETLEDNEAISKLYDDMIEAGKAAGYTKEEIDELIKSLEKTGETTSFKDLDEQLYNAKKSLDEFRIRDAETGNTTGFDVDKEGFEEAKNEYVRLQGMKNAFNASPFIMNLDTSGMDSEMANAISLIQQYQTAVGELQALNALNKQGANIDTSEAVANVQALAEQLNEIPPEVKTTLGIKEDSDFQSAIDNVIAATGTPEVKAKVIIDNSETISQQLAGLNADSVDFDSKIHLEPATQEVKYKYEEEKKNLNPATQNVKFKYEREKRTLNAATQSVKFVYGDQVKTKLPDAYQTVHRVVVDSSSSNRRISGIPRDVDGTAHASGTANAHGNWGAPRTETALVNELGPEIIVRDGRWFTANDGHPGFTGIKKGDIIFNHKQSEELLKNGYVTKGHARMAFAEGTAYAGIRGGGGLPKANKSTPASSVANTVQQAAVNASQAVQKAASTATAASKDLTDWIEIYLDRYDRRIEDLSNVVEDTFESYANRNAHLTEEISTVARQISNERAAYNRYIQQANAVGLNENYARKVRVGEINIENIADENLRDKIQQYQQWYEKALDCQDALEELTRTEKELYATRFELIQTRYQNWLDTIEHNLTTLQNYIDQTEEAGYLVGSAYYTRMIQSEENSIKDLQSERAELVSSLNKAIAEGQIEPYSEKWYELYFEITNVDEAIQDAQKSIIEFNNSIRQLKWDAFDRLQEKADNFITELEFVYDMLDSEHFFEDNGAVTEQGMSAFASLAMQMDSYAKKAQEYSDMVLNLRKDLASDPNNTIIQDQLADYTKSWQESIKSVKDMRESIRDLVKDGFDKELSSLNDIIDKYTELMDNNRDMYNYQQDIIKQQKEITTLQRQVQAWGSDNSEEGAARRQKASNDLVEAQQQLYDTQEERRISETKEMLSDLYNNYEESLNTRLDNIDALIQDVITGVNSGSSTVRETINSVLASIGYNPTESLSTALSGNGAIVSNFVNNTFTTFSASVLSALNGIRVAIDNEVSVAETSAKANVDKMAAQSSADENATNNAVAVGQYRKDIDAGNAAFSKYGDYAYIYDYEYYKNKYKDLQAAFGNDEDKYFQHFLKYGMKEGRQASEMFNLDYYKGRYLDLQQAFGKDNKRYYEHFLKYGMKEGRKAVESFDVKYYKQTYADLATAFGDRLKDYFRHYIVYGSTDYEHRSGAKGYASGVKRVVKPQKAWTDEFGRNETIIRKSDGAVLTRLNIGDSVLKKMASDNLWNMANDPTQFIKDNMPTNTKVSAIGGGTQNNSFAISFNMPNVTNYREFMYAMQKDKQFEKLIQEMTIGQINGNNSLKKYSINIR